MTSPFLTFAEVAAYLRYDLTGPDGAKAKQALTKWLAKYGCRPTLRRGLYRLVQIEAAIARLDAAQTRSRHRGFKTHAARFQKRKRADHAALVTFQSVNQSHAESVDGARSAEQINSVEGAAR